MTTIFDGYDEEYKLLTSSISTKMSLVTNYEEDDEKKISDLNHINDLLTQGGQLVSQMELEVRSLDGATRRELTKKVTQYKSSLKTLKKEYQKVKDKEERNGLFGENGQGVQVR